MLSGVAALYSAFILTSHDSLSEIPDNVKHLLHNNPVVTVEVLKCANLSDISYTVVGINRKVEDAITGGIIGGELDEIGVQMVAVELQPGWKLRSPLIIVTKKTDLVALMGMTVARFANVVFIAHSTTYVYIPLNSSLVEIGNEVSLHEVFVKIWKDMKGFPVPTGLFSQRIGFIEELGIRLGAGVDASALYEFSKYINMTIDLLKTKRSAHPFFADMQVIGGSIELCMNARYFIGFTETSRYLEYTPTVLEDAIVVAVKKAPRLRGWVVFAKIYRWEVWATLLGTVFLSFGVLYLVSERRELSFIIPLALRCIFCIPVRKVPHSLKERLLLGPMLIFSIVIVSSFMAGLYHLIEAGQSHKEFETLEELIESDMPVYTSIPGWPIFLDMPGTPAVEKLSSKIITTEGITDEKLKHGAFVILERDMKFLIDIDIIERDVYFIPEKVKTLTMAYALKRGNPFLDPLSQFIQRVFQAGLFQKWYELTVQNIRMIKGVRQVQDEESPHKRGLCINDLEVAFFSLLTGQCLSTIIFALEVVMNKLTTRKNRRKALRCAEEQEQSGMDNGL